MLAALKARIPSAGREWVRSALRGNPYRIERSPDAVSIGELVSPLRYDVLLRVGHFEFVAAHRELFDDDSEAYEELARAEPYFVWYERVMVPTWRPHLREDRDGFERAWRERLRASVELHDSFARSGFDPAHPIELLAGFSVRPTPTGKRPARVLFAGDGNHRLALLIAAGQELLYPSQYRIKRYRSLVPADTTGTLLRLTGAGWDEYRAFLALGYPTAQLGLAEGQVSVTADPAVATEVEALVATDLPNLAKVPA